MNRAPHDATWLAITLASAPFVVLGAGLIALGYVIRRADRLVCQFANDTDT